MSAVVQLLDPRGTTPGDWCDRMVLELDRFGTIPILMFGMTWKDWARQVVQLYEISILDPPNPDQYEEGDFEEWAIDFNDAVFAGD